MPPYSPDFNSIEMAFTKLKALLRAAAARTVPDLWQAIADAILFVISVKATQSNGKDFEGIEPRRRGALKAKIRSRYGAYDLAWCSVFNWTLRFTQIVKNKAPAGQRAPLALPIGLSDVPAEQDRAKSLGKSDLPGRKPLNVTIPSNCGTSLSFRWHRPSPIFRAPSSRVVTRRIIGPAALYRKQRAWRIVSISLQSSGGSPYRDDRPVRKKTVRPASLLGADGRARGGRALPAIGLSALRSPGGL